MGDMSGVLQLKKSVPCPLPRHRPNHRPGQRRLQLSAGIRRRLGQRQKRRLGDVFGLTAFGVNMTTLPPARNRPRHYHTEQDEFVYIVAGTLVLVTDDGEQELTAGMVAGFKRGKAVGHHLVNAARPTPSISRSATATRPMWRFTQDSI